MNTIFGLPTGELNSHNHWTEVYQHPLEMAMAKDNGLYHNTTRIAAEIESTQQILTQFNLSPQTILNLACGPAVYHTIDLLKLYPHAQILNLDFSQHFVELAQSAFELHVLQTDFPALVNQVQFVQGDLRQLNLTPRTFDLITIYGNSLFYFEDTQHKQILTDIYYLLSPHGILIVSTPNHEYVIQSTLYNPNTWQFDHYLPNGQIITETGHRVYNPNLKRSVGKRNYKNQQGEVLITVHPSCATYPFNSPDPAQLTLEKLGQLAGFNKVTKLPIKSDPNSVGLMANMELVVFIKQENRIPHEYSRMALHWAFYR